MYTYSSFLGVQSSHLLSIRQVEVVLRSMCHLDLECISYLPPLCEPALLLIRLFTVPKCVLCRELL